MFPLDKRKPPQVFAVEIQKIECAKARGAAPKEQLLNWDLPSLSKHTISPSSAVSSARSSNSMEPQSSSKLPNRLPFREMKRTPDGSRYASARKPSYLISKSQSGCEKGFGWRVSGNGWNYGSFITSSIAAALQGYLRYASPTRLSKVAMILSANSTMSSFGHPSMK